MKKKIGKRVERLRNSLGLSKVEFAKQVGLSAQYLGTVESGITGLTLEKAVNICEVTGVSLDYLIRGEGEKEQVLFTLSDKLSDVSMEQLATLSNVILNMVQFLKQETPSEKTTNAFEEEI